MTTVKYEVVEHDGGWAYRVGDVFSEAFPSHAEASSAAETAARHHEQPGANETIEYQDALGLWHEEDVSGRDRPHAVVLDTAVAPAGEDDRDARTAPLRYGTLTAALMLVGAAGFLAGLLLRSARR